MAVIRAKLHKWKGNAPMGPKYVWEPCLILEFLSEKWVVIATEPPPGDTDGGMILQTVAIEKLRLMRTEVPL